MSIIRNDKKKLTQVTLGNGTVGYNRDTTDTIFIISKQDQKPVGYEDPSVIGKLSTHTGDEVIEFKFEGKEALKSVGMMIEDLQIIQKKLQIQALKEVSKVADTILDMYEDIGKQDV